MANKNIEFKATLDTSGFDQKVESIRQKIGQATTGDAKKSIDKLKDLTGSGVEGKFTQQASAAFENQKRKEMALYREEFNLRQRLSDNLVKRESEIKKQLEDANTLQVKKNQLLKEQEKIQDRLSQVSSQNVDILSKAKRLDPDLKGFKGVNQAGSDSSDSSNASDLVKPHLQDGLVKTITKVLGSAISSLSVASITQSVNKGIETYFTGSSVIAGQEARTTSNLANAGGAQELLSGKGTIAMSDMGLRLKAMKSASQKVKGLEAQSGTNLVGSLVTGGLAAAGGSAAGAAIGTGLGTAAGLLAAPFTFGASIPTMAGIGATVGAGIGGTVAGIGTTAGMLSRDDLTMARFKGMIRPGDTGDEAVKRRKSEIFAEQFQEDLENQKATDFFRRQSVDYLNTNQSRFAQTQRMTGLDDKGLLGSLTNNSNGIFSSQDRIGAMNQVLSAGGSSAAGREALTGRGLGLNRNFGLNNGNQVLAQLSRGLGGGETANEEVIQKILGQALENAVKKGMDASQFSRELERYLSMQAQMVEKSGATSKTDQLNVAGLLGAASTTDKSMKGIEAGESAFATMNNRLGAGASDLTKAVEENKMFKDPVLRKLMKTTEGRNLMSQLSTMNPTEVAAQSALFEGAGIGLGEEGANIPGKEIQKRLIDIKNEAAAPFNIQKQQISSIKSMTKELSLPENITQEDLVKMRDQETDEGKRKQIEQLMKKKSDLFGSIGSFGTAGQDFINETMQKKESLGAFAIQGMGLKGLQEGIAASRTRKTSGFETGEEGAARSEQNLMQKALANNAEVFNQYVESANTAKNATLEMIEAFANFSEAILKHTSDYEEAKQNLQNIIEKSNANPSIPWAPQQNMVTDFFSNLVPSNGRP